MKTFEYEKMRERKTLVDIEFEFQGQRFYNFMGAINTLGQEGWEWVGMHEDGYVMKREQLVDEEKGV